MSGLGVNIDHVATVRQARRTVEPDPVWAAVEAELGGADCITFHLRKDRRHICDRDAGLLKQTVRCKLNMEMSLDEEIVGIAAELAPHQATLVPENRQEVTTEGGLDCLGESDRIRRVTRALQDSGVTVSAFVDPEPSQIQAARDAGCDAVELHTGTYANAGEDEIAAALEALAEGLRVGLEAGLVVHAGHGLTYNNVAPVAAMGEFEEFNIGHSIVSRAIFVGMREAVREMKRLIDRAVAQNQ
ncbi:MAG: pyridoxine 5'-phosphate synthase [Planctomycetota bacterium]